MKSWFKSRFTHYFTRTNTLVIFVTISLVVLLIAALIQWIGTALIGITEFTHLVDRARGWLLPVRLVVYAVAMRIWLAHCRLCIERSSVPDIERRARNRMTVAGVLFLVAIEYSCWLSLGEVQLP